MGRSWWGHVKRGHRVAPHVYGGVAMFSGGLLIYAWAWESQPMYVFAATVSVCLALCLPLMLAQASKETPEDSDQDGGADGL